MRIRSSKQLSAVENEITTTNWLETIRNKESKGSSIWVNIAYILHGSIYSIFAYFMRTVQSNFRNLIILYILGISFISIKYLFPSVWGRKGGQRKVLTRTFPKVIIGQERWMRGTREKMDGCTRFPSARTAEGTGGYP